MPKKEIVFLIIVIFVSVSLLCLLLNRVFKSKGKEKLAESGDKEKPVKLEVKEETSNEKPIEIEKKNDVELPTVSVALQDELDEFKKYLKSRIAPENSDEPSLHPYDTPKVNRLDNNFDDFYEPSFFDNLDEFNDVEYNRIPYDEGLFGKSDDLDEDEFNDFNFPRRRKKESKELDVQNLPEKVKILLFTDIFKNRFL